MVTPWTIDTDFLFSILCQMEKSPQKTFSVVAVIATSVKLKNAVALVAVPHTPWNIDKGVAVMISELISVFLPWIAVAIAVPLMLLAVKPCLRFCWWIHSKIAFHRSRRFFSAYTQRGFY